MSKSARDLGSIILSQYPLARTANDLFNLIARLSNIASSTTIAVTVPTALDPDVATLTFFAVHRLIHILATPDFYHHVRR